MPDGRHVFSTGAAERESTAGRDRRHIALYCYLSTVQPVTRAAPGWRDDRELLAHGGRVRRYEGSILAVNGEQIADV